jgi:hypothetical protein
MVSGRCESDMSNSRRLAIGSTAVLPIVMAVQRPRAEHRECLNSHREKVRRR